MPTHDIKTVGMLLDCDVNQELIPIYQRMTDDNLSDTKPSITRMQLRARLNQSI